jgi:hypothetical protein
MLTVNKKNVLIAIDAILAATRLNKETNPIRIFEDSDSLNFEYYVQTHKDNGYNVDTKFKCSVENEGDRSPGVEVLVTPMSLSCIRRAISYTKIRKKYPKTVATREAIKDIINFGITKSKITILNDFNPTFATESDSVSTYISDKYYVFLDEFTKEWSNLPIFTFCDMDPFKSICTDHSDKLHGRERMDSIFIDQGKNIILSATGHFMQVIEMLSERTINNSHHGIFAIDKNIAKIVISAASKIKNCTAVTRCAKESVGNGIISAWGAKYIGSLESEISIDVSFRSPSDASASLSDFYDNAKKLYDGTAGDNCNFDIDSFLSAISSVTIDKPRALIMQFGRDNLIFKAEKGVNNKYEASIGIGWDIKIHEIELGVNQKYAKLAVGYLKKLFIRGNIDLSVSDERTAIIFKGSSNGDNMNFLVMPMRI